MTAIERASTRASTPGNGFIDSSLYRFNVLTFSLLATPKPLRRRVSFSKVWRQKQKSRRGPAIAGRPGGFS